ncbi:MAG TPA: heavy metal-associated domain-containing protein [Terriglobales bacterium]|nr:heavy metal-associated domain-containing protein [Terriglobales bacterium]
MRVSLKSVAGVESVEVSLEKGLAAVKMKPGNTATLKQLQDAITKNGFTMKQSKATVAGTILVANGKTQLKVSGSNDVLQLVPESQSGPEASSMQGKSVIVTGTISEAPKGKSPDSLNYHSLVEDPNK